MIAMRILLEFTNKKCLIACFSRKGQNYVSGKIVDLKVGNTEVIASMIQMKTGGHVSRSTDALSIYRRNKIHQL